MFILKLGVEALKNSNYSLSENSHFSNDLKSHSILKKLKCRRQFELKKSLVKQKNNLKKSRSILFNLLNQNKKQKNLDVIYERPSSLNSMVLTSKTINWNDCNSVRPSSAPETLKFPKLSKFDFNCLTVTGENNLSMQWLMKMIVELTNFEHNHLSIVFLNLSVQEKLMVFKQNWHLLFATYLAEFCQLKNYDIEKILPIMIKDYQKSLDCKNFKKHFRITRMVIKELEELINHIIRLEMNEHLYNLLRIILCGIMQPRNQDGDSIKPFYLQIISTYLTGSNQNKSSIQSGDFDRILECLSKLDSSMIESSFFSEHLSVLGYSNIESWIEKVFNRLCLIY